MSEVVVESEATVADVLEGTAVDVPSLPPALPPRAKKLSNAAESDVSMDQADDPSWEDDDQLADQEASDQDADQNLDHVLEEVPVNSKSSTDAILSSCKANLAGLQDLLLRMRAVPNAQRVLPVQSGIDYLLATSFTAKVLQMADYFPRGITKNEQDTIVETFTSCDLHLEVCKLNIAAAETVKGWTAVLSRGLETGWKNFCLQILTVPGLLHLPPLNLSLLIGNTIADQPNDPPDLDNGTYSSIDTHLLRIRRKRQLKIDPTKSFGVIPQLRRGLNNPPVDDLPAFNRYDELYDAEDPNWPIGPPSYKGKWIEPPPYSPEVPGYQLQNAEAALQALYNNGFQPVSVFTGNINGPIYISHYPTASLNQTTALPAPSPPPRNPSHSSRVPAPEFATALWDFEAEFAGDLSFSVGDKIEIVQRTANENEWWTGRCRGRQGIFPANYVTSQMGRSRYQGADEQAQQDSMLQDERQRPLPGANGATTATEATPETWTTWLWEWGAIIGICIAVWLVLVLSIASGIHTVKYLAASF